MIEAPARLLARKDLLRGLNACDARVYRFIAGAGFGKSTLAWELTRDRGPVALCDMRGVRSELGAWRRLITALCKLDTDGERIAQESVALADAHERNAYVRAIAQRGNLRGTLLVENAEHLNGERWLSPLRSFVSGRPQCTLIVCSRSDLDLHVAATFAPHEFITVREHDLRFDLSDFGALLQASARDRAPERALMWSEGWPLAASRAVALLRRGEELPRSSDSETWLRDLVRETMESGGDAIREIVLRLASLADTGADEILAPLPQHARDAARRQLSAIPFLAERPDGSFDLHALAREELVRLYPGECAQARQSAVREAAARGDYVRCAEIALQQDDVEAAADALIRADHDFYQMPPPRYLAALEHLDANVILQRPQLWMVSEISLKSDFLALNGELEPVFRAKARSLPPRMRMACAALVCFRKGEYDGRWEDGLTLLEEFERDLSDDCVRPRDLVYAAHYRCGAASNCGLDFDAAAHWREFGDELTSALIFYGEFLYWEFSRAYFRGDAAAALAAIERYIAHVRECGYPVYRRASLYRSLFCCWEIDARDAYERYRRELIGLLTDRATPNDLLSRLAWEMLDASSGVPPYSGGPIVSTGCFTNLMLAAQADDYDVVAAAMDAALQMSGSPALRSINVKLSVAAFCFDPGANEALLNGAFDHFQPPAAPALRACVQRLRSGEHAGILEPLAQRFRKAGERFRNRFYVDVAQARIRRGGTEVHLGERELELFMLLAAAGRPLPAIEVAEMLWPDSDDASARNALKVCISRLRSRTGCKDLVISTGGDVMLSADRVQTDLMRAERLLSLAQDGSSAAMRGARAIIERPASERYRAWPWSRILTERLALLRARLVTSA